MTELNKTELAIEAVNALANFAVVKTDDTRVKEKEIERFISLAKAVIEQSDIIITALSNAPQWQPIETAPRDGTIVELYRPPTTVGRYSQIIHAGYQNGRWYWPDETYNPYDRLQFWSMCDEGAFSSNEFTHWMPLPAAPNGGA